MLSVKASEAAFTVPSKYGMMCSANTPPISEPGRSDWLASTNWRTSLTKLGPSCGSLAPPGLCAHWEATVSEPLG